MTDISAGSYLFPLVLIGFGVLLLLRGVSRPG